MKKGRNKVHNIYDPVYRQNYYFFCGSEKKVRIILKHLFRDGASSIELVGNSGKTIFREYDDGTYQIYIWVEKMNISYIVHEAAHAVMHMLRRRKVFTEENFCYCLQFLVGEILKIKKLGRHNLSRRILVDGL